MYDYAVVGSGIGGSAIAASLGAKGKKVALFEKEPYLGGASSTFKRRGYTYNTGATTLAGYQDGFVVKEILDEIGCELNLIKTDPTIVIIQGDKITPRYQDFERFFEAVQTNYPHAKNREFWELVAIINRDFFKMQGHYYSNKNLYEKMKSLVTFLPLLKKFSKYLFMSAHEYINKHFAGIDEEYRVFMEAQIRIVAQAELKDINFFTAAIALSYTFNDNYYAVGGLGKVFDAMSAHVGDIYKSTQVLHIQKYKDYFEIFTKKEIYKAKKVILNTTIYESGMLFRDEEIKDYFAKYKKLDNHQSSFMLYMSIRSDKKFEHHYQIIQKENFVHTLSNALFVSFSDASDKVINRGGEYSITASIHTDTRFWEDEKKYKAQKNELKDLLFKTIVDILQIPHDSVLDCFAATPKTFKRYINRSQLGGNAMTMKNLLPFMPSNDTKIKGLYSVGDSVYAAQGWPGVMMGVKNLKKLLHV